MAEDASVRKPTAERLRLGRVRAGLSQGQVAKLLGVHRPTITEIEAARRKVTAQELDRFADTYGVSVDWLLGRVPERAELSDSRVKLVARDLEKLSQPDLDEVLGFIASLQEGKVGRSDD